MKRKRKHKKEKSKGGSESGSGSGAKAFEKDDERNGSGMEIDNDTPSSTGTDQPQISEKPLARVTVKLKTPKIMESQLNSESDTDKSIQKMGSETQAKNEDSANSLSETKKAPSIKIKSSSKVSEPMKDQKTPPFQQHDKQELETALLVIKKIMKMEAAEPFNVPVNPVALGIPDYFDVIDTPMDFGTICNNLENGAKYANSENVYKDVQYIWDNCFKYNNKGDYILDLMKRVKKNFMKYWNTAGLYSEQLIAGTANGVESSQEKIAPTSQIKVYVKGGLSKKSSKKGHGRRHKSDCLCAICVLKRRRREREKNAKTTHGHIGELSAVESPSGDNSTSDMDESAADRNDMKMEGSKQGSQGSEEDDEEDENEEENDKDKAEATEQVDANKQEQEIQSDPQQLKHNNGLEEKGPKVKAREIKVRENPMLMELCGTLFPAVSTMNSIWSGRHSLIQKHRRSKTSICSSIQAAIDTLKLKQHPT